MTILLSEHFDYKKLMRFTLPSIIMMVFTSIYGVVDGLFASNIVGTTAFAGINIILPFLTILGALGFMVGSGGSALVAKTMGENDYKKANGLFSAMIYLTIVMGIVLAVIGFAFLEPISIALGAEGELIDVCLVYGRIYLAAMPMYMLQYVFQSFLVTAEKPKLGLLITIIAGCTNIVLDALFMAVFHWGVAGASLATVISQVLGGGIPLAYFIGSRKSPLRLGKPIFERSALIKTCTNGSSELMTNISGNIVNILFNFRLMQLAGENGVSAYGVIMYVNFIFTSIYLGYSIGSAPIVSFHYGAGNKDELKNLLRKSLRLIFVFSFVLTVGAELLARPLGTIFVGYDPELLEMTAHGFMIYAAMFFFCGYNIYASSFFTALNNGLISALISFIRTLVFQILCVLVMSAWFGLVGIWLSVVAAEVLSLAVSAVCLASNRKRYGYF